MSKSPFLLLLFLSAALVGCSKQETASGVDSEGNEGSSGRLNVCALLTSEEIQSVQGEPLKEAKANDKSGGGLVVSECYFALPTTANSIIVTVTQKGHGPDARDPKQFWDEAIQRQLERDREKGRGEAGKKPPTLEKVEGVGDEALWVASPFGGMLHVLKGHLYIRITAGGTSDPKTNAPKARKLAEYILKRL